MKARIKDWDDAVKSALADSENWYVEDDSIFGIKRECGDWGEVIEGYKDGEYFRDGNLFAYPMCVVDELEDDERNPDDILRYGKIITDDDVLWCNHAVRIRLVSYNGNLYYHKMVDGDVFECRKVGGANA